MTAEDLFALTPRAHAAHRVPERRRPGDLRVIWPIAVAFLDASASSSRGVTVLELVFAMATAVTARAMAVTSAAVAIDDMRT
jgi:hypothetical protein